MRTFLLLGMIGISFIAMVLAFGLPKRHTLVERDSSIKDSCYLGDTMVNDLSTQLERLAPEIVLIGNSMLGESVDQDAVTRLTGMRAAKVWYPGTGSAWWYLVVKNVLTTLGERPRYVCIFFRDNYLTLPQHRVGGKNRHIIDSFAGENEMLLDEFAYHSQMSVPLLYANSYIPLFHQSSLYKTEVDQELKKLAARVVGKKRVDQFGAMSAKVFDNRLMNQRMLHERQLADERAQDLYKSDFNFQPKRSFLSPIIQMTKEHGMTLVFVRVKRLRDLEPGRQSVALRRYMSKLQTYLDENSVFFEDFTDDQQIEKRHFGKGDHLNRLEGRKLFSQLLAERIVKDVTPGYKELMAVQSP